MADSAEARLLTRLQSTGSNNNIWGGYINDNFEIIGRGSKGYQAIALTGDKTISHSNYSKTNEGLVGFVKFTGSLSSAVSVTFPATETVLDIWNNSGDTVTVKLSGSSGVAIANSTFIRVANDGSDFRNTSSQIVNGKLTVSGVISGVATGVAGTDATNLTQVNALIASGSIPGADGTVKMDAAAASNYLNAAILVSGDVTKTDNGDTMTIGVSVPALDEGKVVFLSQIFG